MPSRCTLSTTGYAACWPLGARATNADSSRRNVDPLLHEYGRPGADRREDGVGLALVLDEPDPLAVVPAARGLDDDREARALGGEAHDLGRLGRRRRAAGTAPPARPSRRRMTTLSWACTSAPGPGRQAIPAASSASRWPVGTCSWSKVTTAQPSRPVPEYVEVGVVADGDVGDDLRGRRVCRLGEQAQRDAEGDRGLLEHPGQLARADDADDRGFHGGKRNGYPGMPR